MKRKEKIKNQKQMKKQISDMEEGTDGEEWRRPNIQITGLHEEENQCKWALKQILKT